MTNGFTKIVVALAGQPNSGKSTIFNMLTGARQHVANYPGVTVEKKTGSFRLKEDRIEIIDLPGTHSLTSYTQEERISRDFLLNEKPAIVVDVVDASNLERNLYLTFQLAEMGISLIVNLNMTDVAEKRGLKIDIEKLSREIGVPVVSTVGNRSRGKDELKKAIEMTLKNGQVTPFRIDYGEAMESALSSLEKHLSENPELSERYPLRWLAIKLMENDPEAKKLISTHSRNGDELLKLVEEERNAFVRDQKSSSQKVIAVARHRRAEAIVETSVTCEKKTGKNIDGQDRPGCLQPLSWPGYPGCYYISYV